MIILFAFIANKHFRLELFPPSRTRPMTPTKKPITDTTPGISGNIQQFSTTALHDEDHLSTQSSLTQETGFFSDHTFPVSAVEAEIDEEQFLDIDTIDTSDHEDEYQDFNWVSNHTKKRIIQKHCPQFQNTNKKYL